MLLNLQVATTGVMAVHSPGSIEAENMTDVVHHLFSRQSF